MLNEKNQPLTDRELDVLTYIAGDLTNREIAVELTMALSTVKWYVRQIYNKLGVDSRQEAVARARKWGLLPAEGQTAPLHVPRPITPFVGRETELTEIQKLLLNPACRLLTLVGSGGSGKTRLAIQTALALAEKQPGQFIDGIYFVSLAPLESSALLCLALVKALEISVAGGTAVSSPEQDDPIRRHLLDFLGRKRLLLVLDNFEHLLDEDSARLITDLLTQTNETRILVTSRASLEIRGEYLFWVKGMATPPTVALPLPLSDLEHYSAVRLFTESARRVTDFALTEENATAVSHICQLVDGLPLAIELAAAWMPGLTPAEIAAEIAQSLDFLATNWHDIPERQRSMRAVFNSSWKLLTRQEQEMLSQMTVFWGSFSREAAREVTGVTDRDLLALVQKCWLQRSGDSYQSGNPGYKSFGRYQLHELIRQYAQEPLRQNPVAWQNAQEQHSTYYAAFVHQLGQAMKGPQPMEAIQSVVADFANIRAAWLWLLESGQIDKLVDQMLFGLLESGLSKLSFKAGLVSLLEMSITWLEKRDLSEDSRLSYQILSIIFITLCIYLDPDTGLAVYVQPEHKESLLQIWDTVDKLEAEHRWRFWFVCVVRAYGWNIDQEAAITRLEQFLARLPSPDATWLRAYTTMTLANLWHSLDEATAEKYLLEAQTHFQLIGNSFQLAYIQEELADLYRTHDLEKARENLWAAYRLYEELGMTDDLLLTAPKLAELNMVLGDIGAAFQQYHHAWQMAEKMGSSVALRGVLLHSESMIQVRYGDLEAARQLRQQYLQLLPLFAREFDLAWGYWEMGEIERVAGDVAAARQWFAASLSLFERLQYQRGIAYYERGLGNIAHMLGHYEEARQLFASAVHRLQEDSHIWGISCTLSGLGRAEVELSLYEPARSHFREAWQLAKQIGNPDLCLEAAAGLAHLHMALAEYELAVTLSEFVRRHPASWNETKRRATAVYETAVRHLTPTQKQNALATAQTLTLARLQREYGKS